MNDLEQLKLKRRQLYIELAKTKKAIYDFQHQAEIKRHNRPDLIIDISKFLKRHYTSTTISTKPAREVYQHYLRTTKHYPAVTQARFTKTMRDLDLVPKPQRTGQKIYRVYKKVTSTPIINN